MKQQSTTLVPKLSLTARACIVAVTILAVSTAPFAGNNNIVFADQYDNQIAALQQTIDQYDAQAGKLRDQANNLQQKVAAIQLQKGKIQAQINISTAKQKKLEKEIAATEKKIEANKDVLGSTIADLYVDGDISPLVLLASSDNIADYVDNQANREQVQNTVNAKIKEIEHLKQVLESKKNDVEKLLAQQRNNRKALQEKQDEQQRILNITQGKQSVYQELSAKSRAEQNRVRAAQQAAIAAAIASSGGATLVRGGVAGGYPWNSSNCPMIGYYSTVGSNGDGGDGHGYGCRQCASYAAWRVAKETGLYPENWGNAKDFPSSASGIFPTGYTPRAGSLAVMGPASSGASEGHIVWVEAVGTGDHAGQLLVSQYNYNYGAGYGMYSEMWLSASIFDYGYIYVK